MTKAFPLFDDMAELCDDVLPLVLAFRATGEASSEQDANGSEEGDEGREVYLASEVEQLVCLVLACVPIQCHSLSHPSGPG